MVAFVAQGQLKTIDPIRWDADNAHAGDQRDRFVEFREHHPLHSEPRVAAARDSRHWRNASPCDDARREPAATSFIATPFFLPDGRHFLYVAVSARSGETTGARARRMSARSIRNESGRLAHRRRIVGGVLAGTSGVPARQSTGGPTLRSRSPRVDGRSQTDYRTSRTRRPIVYAILGHRVRACSPTNRHQDLAPSSSGSTASGRRLGTLGEPADYGDIVLSPDGRRAAVSVLDAAVNTRDIWVFDISRGVRTRVTFDPSDDVAAGMVVG